MITWISFTKAISAQMTEGKFDGSAFGPSAVEWIEKAELVCTMCQVKCSEHVVPLRLMSGAFVVY